MSDQLKMFPETTLEASASVTSSPESEAGATRSGSRGGPTTGRCGPDPALVSRFRARDNKKAMPIDDICGPIFTASSPHADLQRRLESRLVAALEGSGSPLYALIWGNWDMPAGPPISRLRASAHRTSGKDSGGWPTPMAGSPKTESYNEAGDTCNGRKTRLLVNNVAGWHTPMASEPMKKTRRTMAVGWPTPDARSASKQRPGAQGGPTLAGLVHRSVSGWATPTASDHKDGVADLQKHPVNYKLGRQAMIGPSTDSSSARTEEGAPLNPDHSRWLMGYPIVWGSYADTETQ